jgi:3-oxoacyl-[acyl-carrier protein] reductase
MEGRERPGPAARALEGRAALVTGAARGIGEAVARSLARDGANVTVVDLPERSRELTLLASDIAGRPLVADVTWPRAGAFMAEQVEKEHGRLHVLVHNAGVFFERNVQDMAPGDWKRAYGVNLASVVRLTQALESLMAPDGRILGIASIAGLAGVGGQTCYSGSKAGLAEYLCALGRERAGTAMTVNAIAAGFVHTDLTAGLPWYKREIGLRFSGMMQGGLPGDIGNLAAFLASPAAGALTGQVIRACGANLIGW